MTYDIEFVELPHQNTAVVCGHLTTEQIASFVGPAFGEVIDVLGQQGLQPTGAPFGRYRVTGEDEFDVEFGFPCSGVVEPSGRVEPSELPGGPTARTLHVGSYGDVGAAYSAVVTRLTDEGCEITGTPWECYLDGPEVPEPRTEVFFPCAPTPPHRGD
jgi:effector-binding domain-containing protein